MESHPPAAFPWTSSPLDEYLASMEVCEAGVNEGQMKVEAFLAVGEQVDPFRVRPPSAPLTSVGLLSAVWALARSFLFAGRRFEVGPLLRPLELGQLYRRCANV